MALEGIFEESIHALAGHRLVTDIRNFGLMGGIDLEPREGAPGARGLEAHKLCFWEEDLVIRNGGDCLQFSPFLNSRPEDIAMTFDKVAGVLDRLE
jgi:beta-alanine--pyruvate transaminase